MHVDNAFQREFATLEAMGGDGGVKLREGQGKKSKKGVGLMCGASRGAEKRGKK